MSLVLIFATSCSSPKSSDPDIGQVDRVFIVAAATWDKNRDDIVTCDEWKTYASALFVSADSNHDGVLDANEFNFVTVNDKTFVIADVSYFDTNGDRRVGRAEFVDRPNPAFIHLDKDKDCRLTVDELAAARSLGRSPPWDRPPSGGGPKGKDKGGGPPI